jgi:hypothetical protein
MVLVRFARQRKDVLKPYGQTDVLLLYAIVADKIGPYLLGREIASRIWLPNKGGGRPYIIKRGSKDEPLYARELAEAVTPEFLKIREAEEKLSRAEEDLTPVQRKVWRYFVPRKLINFFYATNTEDPSGSIDRVFLDLDRGQGVTEAQAHAGRRRTHGFDRRQKAVHLLDWKLVPCHTVTQRITAPPLLRHEIHIQQQQPGGLVHRALGEAD